MMMAFDHFEAFFDWHMKLKQFVRIQPMLAIESLILRPNAVAKAFNIFGC
jgi:hypothetical protein